MIKPADETLMGPKLSNWNKLCVCVPLHDWLVQQQTFHWFGNVKDKRRLSIFRPARTTSEKFGNAKITGHLRFVFEENSGREITLISWCHRFWQAPLSKCFPPTAFSNSSGLKSVFEKLRFRDGLVCTVGLTVEINLPCQIFPSIVWTGPLSDW